MNSYTNSPNTELNRRQLEQLWTTAERPTLSDRATQALKQVGGWLLTALTEGNSLRIWTEETGQGTRWYVHDPLSQRQQNFDSEESLRVWLEQRYYEQ